MLVLRQLDPADPRYKLKLKHNPAAEGEEKRRGPRYTPLSKRQDRPNAILWLLRNHPELKDAQVMRLVGTTKSTIQQIRERTHWNSGSLQPMDPVTLGLCSQIDLDFEVQRAAKDRPAVVQPDAGAKLLPTEVSTAPAAEAEADAEDEDLNADAVFAKLKGMSRIDEDDED